MFSDVILVTAGVLFAVAAVCLVPILAAILMASFVASLHPDKAVATRARRVLRDLLGLVRGGRRGRR